MYTYSVVIIIIIINIVVVLYLSTPIEYPVGRRQEGLEHSLIGHCKYIVSEPSSQSSSKATRVLIWACCGHKTEAREGINSTVFEVVCFVL